jgi:DNA-binding MarR family transcriptional regulator
MADQGRTWAFVQSQGLVWVEVAFRQRATVRELAERAQLTERQAHRVLGDLVDGGYITRERVGRRNRYQINEGEPMRHPTNATHRIGELLAALTPS